MNTSDEVLGCALQQVQLIKAKDPEGTLTYTWLTTTLSMKIADSPSNDKWGDASNSLLVHVERVIALRNLDCDDLGYLLALICQNLEYFLDELLHLLETNWFISVHYVTIHHELKQADVSSKKLKKITLERTEERRATFISRMAQDAPEEIGFLDEFSKDARSVGRQ